MARKIPHDGYQTGPLYGYVFVVGPTPFDSDDERVIVVTDARTGERVDGFTFPANIDPSDRMAAWLIGHVDGN